MPPPPWARILPRLARQALDPVPALGDAVSSTEREYVEPPGGHISLIAGRGAAIHCRPKGAAWPAPRSHARREEAGAGASGQLASAGGG